MNDLNLMTPEELQAHIQKCQAILEAKQNEKVNELIGNLASEAHRLLQERPWARVKAEYYDEEREENIDIEIDLEYLAYEDNYIV
jgi:hypothetical protein